MATRMNMLVICASPRPNGRSAAIAEELKQANAATDPNVDVRVLNVSRLDVSGCIGCDACREAGECAFGDDMTDVMDALDHADELYVVSPVYFAGPPSQFKAMLDRLQPHYWRETRKLPKRPAHLHVVGEGGDPHGFEPLVTICRSALAVAGFELVEVVPHIGSNAATGADTSREVTR